MVAEPAQAAVTDESQRHPVVAADHFAQLEHFLFGCPAAGHRLSVPIVVGIRLAGGEPDTARAKRIVQQLGHLLPLSFGRFPGKVLAQYVTTEGAVADHKTGVDPDMPVEPIQVLTETLPTPRDPLFEPGQRHAFHLCHHAPRIVGVTLLERGQGETAVAGDDRRHSVPARGRGKGIPEQLGIVMGVRIDEPRNHHKSLGVEGPNPSLVHLAELGDHAVLDPYISPNPLPSPAVNDRAPDDHVVQHATLLAGSKTVRLEGYQSLIANEIAGQCSYRVPTARRAAP